MEIRKILLGRGEFKSPKEIIDVVKSSGKHDSEDFDNAEPLLIFQTSTQQTWLVATDVALYCVLDDLNRASTRVQWATSASEFKKVGEQFAGISARDKNDRVGLLQIGSHKNWFYSKKLFSGENVVDRLSKLVSRKMASAKRDSLPNGSLATR